MCTVADNTAEFELLGLEWGKANLGGTVASILPFMKPSDGAFDDQATRVMGEAFDAAFAVLRKKQPAIVYETIAARIIAAAHKGERDPVRLRNAGLAGLGYESKTG